MPRRQCLFIALILVFAGFVLPACSPYVNYPGKQVVRTKLEKELFYTADGVILPVRSWLPQEKPFKAIIVAVHGFNDYSNSFTAAGNYLSRQGIACYAYDQRGFGAAPGRGLWAGTEAYTSDLTAFVAEVRRLNPKIPVYLLGESMGGAVTIVAVTGSNPPDVDGVILVAPAVWGWQTMPWYQRWLLAAAAHSLPWMELTGKGLKITPSDNREMLQALGRDPLVIKATRIDSLYGITNLMDTALLQAGALQLPALVQYGKHDQVIPKEPTLLMLAKMPATTRKAFYEHGYHMLLRDLQGEKPLADIVVWVNGHNSPLPYGADRWQ